MPQPHPALFSLAPLIIAGLFGTATLSACELCAIYNASNARAESTSGFTFSVAEQFTRFGTELLDDQEITRANPDFLDDSITHLVPGYNFSPQFGISLNVPMVYRSFQRTDLRFSLTGPPVLFTERGSEFDLGDIALIGRWTVLAKREMKYDIIVNLLGGIKFPTGETDRLQNEVEQSEIFNALLPPGTPHDPLEHSLSSVHQHDLSPGSGSFDGIFGVTLNGRWKRWFFNGQFQYSLRTEGEASFEYGDDLLVSGGPGRYWIANKHCSLSLQALATYETMAHDRLLGQTSARTGSTGWYFGPQINFTLGEHFSANAGVDIPLQITANGFQNVPDYRIHGGFSWRF